jgi:hypothetical protein
MFNRCPARLGLLLAAVLTAGVRAAPDAAGGDATSSQAFPPADARRGPGGKDSPEVKALLRQRREVLEAEVDLARKYLGEPNFSADVWAALAERLLVASTDVAETRAERVAAYRTFRDNLMAVEEQLKKVAEPSKGQGYYEYGQKLWSHSRRLQAEAMLLRAEMAKDGSPPTSVDPPAVRQAVLAWRDSVRQWAKMWLESRRVLIPPFAREIASSVLSADLAAAEDAKDQLAAYQAYRDRLAVVEKDTRTEVERRRYNPSDYLKIKEMLCDADVVLGRMKAGKSAEKDPPDVRAALEEWVRTVGFETDALRKHYEAGKVPLAESLAVDESLLREELVAASKPEERVAAYKKYLGKMRAAEAALKARVAENAAVKEELARLTFHRAGTELTLLQLGTAPGAKFPPSYRALLGEQRDAIRVELDRRSADWAAGQGDFQLLQESAGNLLLVALDLAEQPSDRLAAYQAHADTMRWAERQCQALLDAKKAPQAWLLWSRGARLEAETWLLRAKANLTAAAKP